MRRLKTITVYKKLSIRHPKLVETCGTAGKELGLLGKISTLKPLPEADPEGGEGGSNPV